MKPAKNLFSVASLFEWTDYISVYNDANAEVIGRIYTEGDEYKAVAISGATDTFDTLAAATWFIKRMPVFKDKRIPYKIELYKVNEFGQRSYVDTFYNPKYANSEKQKQERWNPEYTFVLVNHYTEELKLF